MNKIIGIVAAFLALSAAGCYASGAAESMKGDAKGAGEEIGFEPDAEAFSVTAKKLPGGALSEAEKNGLLKLREEEKLARDVYAFLAEKWGTRVFANIEASETKHMGFVKVLLDKYGLVDPVKDDRRGVFSGEEFARLYADLTARGSASLVEAISVGLLIEELDIRDVRDVLASSGNADVRVLLLNLEKGSRNHLRAFQRQLDRNGGTYRPSYLSAEEFRKILDGSDRGTGMITDPNYVF